MSYLCTAKNENVIGERRVLVPIKIRKVTYIGQIKSDDQSNYLQFAGESAGWEIVEEVPVCLSLVDSYAKAHPPIVVGNKEVIFLKPRPKKEKFSRTNYDEEYDKPDVD